MKQSHHAFTERLRTLFEEEAARKRLESRGVTFHEPADDLKESIAAFRAAQPASAAGIARETFGIKDSEALLKRFQATVSKWEGLLKDVPVENQAEFADLMRSEIYDKIDLESYGLN